MSGPAATAVLPEAALAASGAASVPMPMPMPSPVPLPAVLPSLLPREVAQAVARTQAQLDPLMPWLMAALLLGVLLLARRTQAPGSAAFARGARQLALALGLGWALLATAVAQGAGWLQRADAAAAGWSQAHAGWTLRSLAVRLSDAGDVLSLTFVALALMAWLLLRRRAALALGCLLAIGFNGVSVRALKHLFERERPAHDGAWLTSGFSFPSGHAAGSVLVLGLLAWWLAAAAPPRWRGAVVLTFAAAVAAIAASRVVLQVHFLSDVLGGLCWGGACLALALAWLEPHRRTAEISEKIGR